MRLLEVTVLPRRRLVVMRTALISRLLKDKSFHFGIRFQKVFSNESTSRCLFRSKEASKRLVQAQLG